MKAKHIMQAWYFTEATKAIVSMPPGQCLGALEMLQFEKFLNCRKILANVNRLWITLATVVQVLPPWIKPTALSGLVGNTVVVILWFHFLDSVCGVSSDVLSSLKCIVTRKTHTYWVTITPGWNPNQFAFESALYCGTSPKGTPFTQRKRFTRTGITFI